MNNPQQTIFSGVQPSGNLHIGNYLGAIKQFTELQKENNAIFCVVDLHAITVPQDPKTLREKTLETAMIYLACGIDPNKSIVFIQSHVPAHTELAWILNTFTPAGELWRMTQFRDKTKSGYTEIWEEKKFKKVNPDKEEMGKNFRDVLIEQDTRRQSATMGLLDYPILMAADILLYQTDAVPVGEDQKQHVELTRSIAERFNNRFGQTFKIPKEILNNSARIMGLDDPAKKMSKSAESKNNYVAILEDPDEIRRKFKIAVTDSESELDFDPANRPAISNLLNIYNAFSGIPTNKVTKQYSGKGYAEFKKDLGELTIEKLSPIQNKYRELEQNKDYVNKILKDGAEKARAISEKTLQEVKEKIGLI